MTQATQVTAGEPHLCPQDMEISVAELQTILNRIIAKREILGVHPAEEEPFLGLLIALAAR